MYIQPICYRIRHTGMSCCRICRALLPACEANSSPVPVVPLVEPKTQSSNVRPGQEDAVLESEVGTDESSAISSASSSATAAVFTTKYCSACLKLTGTGDSHTNQSIVHDESALHMYVTVHQAMSCPCLDPTG